jgi:hypothetical protein
MTPDEIRTGIEQRWRIWRPDPMRLDPIQRRKYSLLVVNYCRRQFDHRWGDRRRTLLNAAEQIAGRWSAPEHADELRQLAQRLLDRANHSLLIEQNSMQLGHAVHDLEMVLTISPADAEAIRLLAMTFDDPEGATAELVLSPLSDAECLLGVMECLRPLEWDKSAAWFDTELPADARKWAWRIYDTREFSALPILADRLEDAGCTDRPLLDHCRCGGWHGRGCAAIDRLCGHVT